MTDQKRVAELERVILYHNHCYYDLDAPEISDYDYDQLFEALKKLKPDSDVLQDKGKASYGVKYTHPEIMGSLSKGHSDADVFDVFRDHFPKKTFLVAMDKIDGMSIGLHYSYGKLIRAVTRGDGYIGEIVTDNVRQFTNVPLFISDPAISSHEWIEVRGEGYVDTQWYYANKERLEKEEGRKTPFKHPRSYTAGSVRQKNTEITKNHHISFVGYKLIYHKTTETDNVIKSFNSVLETLSSVGFEIPSAVKVTTKELISDVITLFDKTRNKTHYMTDGIVFMIDDLDLFDRLGVTGKCPKGAIAYKFDTDKEDSTLIDIEWQVGRTGKVTPVGIIDPIDLAGSTIGRLTLNNLDYIQNQYDVAIGDTILIEKANEIIPKLVDVVIRSDKRYLNIPNTCPSCGEKLSIEMPFLMCNNSACPAQIMNNIEHFMKKLDVKGIADKTLERILESGLADDLHEIMLLDIPDLLMIGFGQRQSEIFVEALNGIKATPEKFLGALGVDGAGSRTFTEVLKNISFEDLINSKFTVKQLIDIEGIAETSAEKIKQYFDENTDHVNLMLEHVEVEVKQASTNALNGKSFCITGTLSRKRKEVEATIEDNGGVIKSVSKNLDYLIAGADAGSKLDKATKLGIKILTEDDLFAMVG